MATMLIPGHDRDAAEPTLLSVEQVVAMSDEQLAEYPEVRVVHCPLCIDGSACGALTRVPDCPADEYTPTPEEEATVRMFLAITPDVPDVVGYDDARTVLDKLAYDEWQAAA